MHKRIVFLFLVCSIHFLIAQVTNTGVPVSWEQDNSSISKSGIKQFTMPDFDLQKIQSEDRINDQIMGKAYRFGYEFDVAIDIIHDGMLEVLPNGDHLYRALIHSKDANTLNFVFSTYQLPKGASVYFYNDEKTDLLGAYTDAFNNTDKLLGTWMVEGSKIWIEYLEPKAVIGQGKLFLSKVIHGYRSVSKSVEKSINSSGSCHLDVNCSIGDDFDAQKERLRHSVALIVMDGFVCSGALINNVNTNGIPFFLTANHCDKGDSATWAFRFNWVSPTSSCASTSSSTTPLDKHTTSGAKTLVTNTNSDVRLLTISGGLDPDWDLELAGWDRSGEIPSDFVVGIHHPSGDVMKVSRENHRLSKQQVSFMGERADMWQVTNWDKGATESGSSGSPLFDAQGRIIGQLAGGSAKCNGLVDNNLFDMYGRFDISWGQGNAKSTRLADWLDPENTGTMVLNSVTYSATERASLDDKYLEDTINTNITIFPNPSTGIFNLLNSNRSRLAYTVVDLVGKKIAAGFINNENDIVDVTHAGIGVYFMIVNDLDTNAVFTNKLVVQK